MKIERLRELLAYDPGSGLLTWQVSRGKAQPGRIAGSVNTDGYVRIMADGERISAHRAAFALMTGAWPEATIDHRNGVRSDNRWSNIRPATSRQQAQNRKAPVGAASALLGAHRDRERNCWLARIRHEGRTTHLGRFASAEEAHDAYMRAKARIHDFDGAER